MHAPLHEEAGPSCRQGDLRLWCPTRHWLSCRGSRTTEEDIRLLVCGVDRVDPPASNLKRLPGEVGVALITRQLQAFEHLGGAFDSGGLSSAGAEHASIEIIICECEVPFSKAGMAKRFDEGRPQRPKPAAHWVFNADQCSSLVCAKQESDACSVHRVRSRNLLGLKGSQTWQAKQCIGPSQRPSAVVAWPLEHVQHGSPR